MGVLRRGQILLAKAPLEQSLRHRACHDVITLLGDGIQHDGSFMLPAAGLWAAPAICVVSLGVCEGFLEEIIVESSRE